MAATRLSLPVAKVRRESYRWFCPTCGRRSSRDGRHGARNSSDFCDSTCFSKFRNYASQRSIFVSGNSILSRSASAPLGPGPLGS